MKNFDPDTISNGTSLAVIQLSKLPDFEGKVANAGILALRKVFIYIFISGLNVQLHFVLVLKN